MTKVFVYGTLKKGFSNHRVLNNSKFLGAAYTQEKFSLYCNGFFPYIVKERDSNINVHGEVYGVDDKTLRSLDALEGYNQKSTTNLYDRQIHQVYLNNKDLMEVYIYVLDDKKWFERIKNSLTKFNTGVWMSKNFR